MQPYPVEVEAHPTPHDGQFLAEYRKNKATFHPSPPASVSSHFIRVPPGVPPSRTRPPPTQRVA
jgi:hypothetical protein